MTTCHFSLCLGFLGITQMSWALSPKTLLISFYNHSWFVCRFSPFSTISYPCHIPCGLLSRSRPSVWRRPCPLGRGSWRAPPPPDRWPRLPVSCCHTKQPRSYQTWQSVKNVLHRKYGSSSTNLNSTREPDAKSNHVTFGDLITWHETELIWMFRPPAPQWRCPRRLSGSRSWSPWCCSRGQWGSSWWTCGCKVKGPLLFNILRCMYPFVCIKPNVFWLSMPLLIFCNTAQYRSEPALQVHSINTGSSQFYNSW